jgi:hypothetical protein
MVIVPAMPMRRPMDMVTAGKPEAGIPGQRLTQKAQAAAFVSRQRVWRLPALMCSVAGAAAVFILRDGRIMGGRSTHDEPAVFEFVFGLSRICALVAGAVVERLFAPCGARTPTVEVEGNGRFHAADETTIEAATKEV